MDLDYIVYPRVSCERNLVIAHGGLPRKCNARRQRIRLTVFLGFEERGAARGARRASKVRHLILSDGVISTLVADIFDYVKLSVDVLLFATKSTSPVRIAEVIILLVDTVIAAFFKAAYGKLSI